MTINMPSINPRYFNWNRSQIPPYVSFGLTRGILHVCQVLRVHENIIYKKQQLFYVSQQSCTYTYLLTELSPS
jgi:hypothetical protein